MNKTENDVIEENNNSVTNHINKNISNGNQKKKVLKIRKNNFTAEYYYKNYEKICHDNVLNANEDILKKSDIYHIASNKIKSDSLVLEDQDQNILLHNRNEKTNNNNDNNYTNNYNNNDNNNKNNNNESNDNNDNNNNNNDNNNNNNNNDSNSNNNNDSNNNNNNNNNNNDNGSKTSHKSDYNSMNNIINNDNNSDKHKTVEVYNGENFPPIVQSNASDKEIVNNDKKFCNFEITKDKIIVNTNIIDTKNASTDIKSTDNNEENDINLNRNIANENSMDYGSKIPVVFLPRSSFKFVNSRALESREVMIEIGELVGGGREGFW